MLNVWMCYYAPTLMLFCDVENNLLSLLNVCYI